MINLSNIKPGYVPSTPDIRNYNISRLVAPVNVLPDVFKLDMSKVNIEDQGDIGCCVSEGACYYLAYKNNDLFSVGFIYGNRSVDDSHEQGMQPLEMLKHLKNEGNVLRKDFPLLVEMTDIETEVLKAKPSLLDKASKYKIAAYAQLNNINDIKNAIYQLKAPVLIAVDVYLTFAIPDPTQFIPVPVPALMDKSYGGHLVIAYGWNEKGLNIYNSWGVGQWTKDGTAVLDYNYPLLESWSMTDKAAQPPQPTPINKWWRVQAGAFKSIDNAKAKQDALKAQGYDTYLVLVDGLYKVQLGAFGVEQNCRNYSATLKAKGIDNFVVCY